MTSNNAMEQALKEAITGEIRFDPISRRVYSVDASIFEVEPLGVVIPRTKEELVKAARIALQHNIPIIPRGAGTGIAGGCIGKGLIIDTTKYLNNILEINIEEEYAVVQPGVVQDQLNEALAPHGYRLGPNTSTGNRATLGGMVANNSAGSHSLHYGKMVDHVLEVEMLLSTGELVRFNEKTTGPIKDAFLSIKEKYGEEIEKRFPKIPRRVSGYNLDEHTLCKVITGSEGSFGILTEIKVQLSKIVKPKGAWVLHFEQMSEGMEVLEKILAYHPIAVEMIDRHILEMARLSPTVKDKLGWLRGNPEAVFVVEVTTDIKEMPFGYDQVFLPDPKEIWEVRKSGLTLLLSKRSYNRAVAFIEDISVAPEHLAAFMNEFRNYLKRIGKEAGIYGHVGSGAMHLRPYLDLRKEEEVALMKQIMLDVTEMLLKHGGTLSGEHGDGMLRSWLNKKLFGETIYEAFLELKRAFDPRNLMNPGKVVNGEPIQENLRLSPSTEILEYTPFLDFSREGGFSLSADLCNGNGQCRKKSDLMCPSFQASNEEYDTTRARAQALRGIIHGHLPVETATSKELYDILDLCIECKGCKKECPSQVDMAKMKSEFLYHYQERHGYGLRNRLFTSVTTLNKLPAPIVNFLNERKWLLNLMGIAPQRTLPKRASTPFSTLFRPQLKHNKTVVLFNDTFTQYNNPEIGTSALKVFDSLGYNVIVPTYTCCGRPYISKGFLKQAKQAAGNVVDRLYPFAEQGFPIITLEPSCHSALIDDYEGLLGYTHEKLQVLKNATTSFDEFIAEHPLTLKTDRPILLHGHCHQKALIGTSPTMKVLRSVGAAAEIPSGCCGMAGSFGYEKEHYAFSMKIGALKLFPAIKNTAEETLLVANGISCRHQIADGTGRQAYHLAQILANLA